MLKKLIQRLIMLSLLFVGPITNAMDAKTFFTRLAGQWTGRGILKQPLLEDHLLITIVNELSPEGLNSTMTTQSLDTKRTTTIRYSWRANAEGIYILQNEIKIPVSIKIQNDRWLIQYQEKIGPFTRTTRAMLDPEDRSESVAKLEERLENGTTRLLHTLTLRYARAQ